MTRNKTEGDEKRPSMLVLIGPEEKSPEVVGNKSVDDIVYNLDGVAHSGVMDSPVRLGCRFGSFSI